MNCLARRFAVLHLHEKGIAGGEVWSMVSGKVYGVEVLEQAGVDHFLCDRIHSGAKSVEVEDIAHIESVAAGCGWVCAEVVDFLYMNNTALLGSPQQNINQIRALEILTVLVDKVTIYQYLARLEILLDDLHLLPGGLILLDMFVVEVYLSEQE
jgi:hypothetical protein